ncbi:MAG: NTP transferase domain-containing protein, partial [Planctomycetota bacterium]
MHVAILAGGMGTRLAEETEIRPKPMVEIGGRPILWHILSHFARFGLRDFAIALGYKGDQIKRFFVDCAELMGSMTVDLSSGRVDRAEAATLDWRVHLVDTGTETNTGGRVRRLRDWLGTGTFLLTYGDGVSDVDIDALPPVKSRQG